MSSFPAVESLILKAPLTGPVVALEQVPDPVFSQKMVGDGISIDPVSQQLLAPCAGKVIQLHRANHALTLQAANGLEIMMHIGLETVALKGAGFSPRVEVGDSVQCGDVLIEFDADFIATRAKSLLTQIVISNSEQVANFVHGGGYVTATKDQVLELVLQQNETAEAVSRQVALSSNEIIIGNHTGLHARPSAVLAAAAKEFRASIQLQKNDSDQAVNAKSLVSIMGLEVDCGDRVTLVASGEDAAQAIDALEVLICNGLGEDCTSMRHSGDVANQAEIPATVQQRSAEDSVTLPRSQNPSLLLGVTASPGLAVGQVYQLAHGEIDVDEKGGDISCECQSLFDAIAAARQQLADLQNAMQDSDKAAIFEAHQELLQDPELVEAAGELIAAGKSAAYAWKQAYTHQSTILSNLKNELLAARANDLRDVGRRVLQILLGMETDAPELPENTILIAEDLTPSDTANLDRDKVLGFCTMTGGASSHVAILARSMGIAAIAGIDARALAIPNGSTVILDAGNATLRLNPSDSEVQTVENRLQRLAQKRELELASALLPAVTSDGKSLEVVANVGGVEDARKGVELGGEGIGLLRSEFLFMDRAKAPTEEEQFDCYAQIAKTLADKQPLIIRTLDVGGDKPLDYLPIAEEENPFLGLRGIRVMLQQPELFRIQLRAILRASAFGNVHIMFPMVTTLCDLRKAKALLEEERLALGVAPIPVGIMVEVPTTALMAEQFAKEVDFFSIGTNDLAQYTLAIDRGHPDLAAQADGLNPGVLHLIAHTVKGAKKHGKWVGVCGGIASDPQAVPVLLGLGVDELSVSVPSIPEIKAQIRSLKLTQCRALAALALQKDTAAEVRALIPASQLTETIENAVA